MRGSIKMKKASQFLLIDGYNLVLVAGLIKTLSGPGNVARARERLLGWLTGRLDEPQRARTTVVFDAQRHAVGELPSQNQGITVLYSTEYPSADEMLEELIRVHSAPKQLVVVSSDHRIRDAARRRKAISIDSHSFYERIKNDTITRPAEDSSDRPSQSSTVFSDDLIQELEEEIDRSQSRKPPGEIDLAPPFPDEMLDDF